MTSGLIIALLVAINVPNFVNARFDSSAEPLTVRVLVRDMATGKAVHGATVSLPNSPTEEGPTDAQGRCEMLAHFRATGKLNELWRPRSGMMHLFGTMRVRAPGYAVWEESFADLFGPFYDYVQGGSTVTQVVTLARQTGSSPR